MRSEILGLFDKDGLPMTSIPVAICRILDYIQKPISPMQKSFYVFFMAFLKSKSSLEHLEKKYKSPSLSISEVIYSGRGGT